MKLVNFSKKKSQKYTLKINEYFFIYFDNSKNENINLYTAEININSDKNIVQISEINESHDLAILNIYCESKSDLQQINHSIQCYLTLVTRYKEQDSSRFIKDNIFKRLTSDPIGMEIHNSESSINPRNPSEINETTIGDKRCFFHFYGKSIVNYGLDVYILFDTFTIRLDFRDSFVWGSIKNSVEEGKQFFLEFAKKFIEELEIFDSTKVDCSHLKPGVTFIPNEDAEKDITPITDFGW
ncbi:hypothetical protein MAH1_02590 [Sessilibacter sp. MAH1]